MWGQLTDSQNKKTPHLLNNKTFIQMKKTYLNTLKSLSRFLLIGLVATVALSSCKKDDDDDTEPEQKEEEVIVTPLETKTVTNLDAVSAYVYYSLETGSIIPSTDSNSTKWDIAISASKVIVNSKDTGPGKGEGQYITGIFDELKTAPANGYVTSLPTGSGKAWYDYNSTTHIITPTAGKILVIKTASGKYAKIEFLSYYKGYPNEVEGTDGRYISFQYVYQPDGSSNF